MIDIFLKDDVLKLFKHKHVVFMGDSNVRAQYKDMLCLLQNDKFISLSVLRTKMEKSCLGDRLVRHGEQSNYRGFREERKAKINDTHVSFYFITSVYDNYVRDVLDDLSSSRLSPDVLIVNSCLWDVSRWGPKSVASYKENLVAFMKKLKKCMPDCLVIWLTTPPISKDVTGGFLLKEIEFLKYSLRFHVMEANNYARKVVVDHGFDVLDLHYHLQWQIHLRCDDGVHWTFPAVRYGTNLILSHTSLAWNIPLPHRFNNNNDYVEVKDDTATKEDHLTPKTKIANTEIKHSINKENNTIRHSPIKIPSTLNESNIVETQIAKKQKVEFVSPVTRKKKNKRKRFQESYHAYSKRMEHDQRQKRIRENQKNAAGTTEYQNFPHQYSSYQQDSGYFSSPNQSQNSFQETQKFINSPRHIPLPPNSRQISFSDAQKFINSPRHIPLPPSPYHSQVNVHNSPFHLHQPQIPRSFTQRCDTRQVIHAPNFNNRRTLLPTHNVPFQFNPSININFTNDDPFGIYF